MNKAKYPRCPKCGTSGKKVKVNQDGMSCEKCGFRNSQSAKLNIAK